MSTITLFFLHLIDEIVQAVDPPFIPMELLKQMLSMDGEKSELLFLTLAVLKRHKLFYHFIGATGILQILYDGIGIRIFILS